MCKRVSTTILYAIKKINFIPKELNSVSDSQLISRTFYTKQVQLGIDAVECLPAVLSGLIELSNPHMYECDHINSDLSAISLC